MKLAGLILSVVAALQFASGEARLCCNWAVFFKAPAAESVSSRKDEWTATCPNCPQSPEQGLPVGSCACPSAAGTEAQTIDGTVQVSQERLIKASDAQAPPLRVAAAYGAATRQFGENERSSRTSTPVYILHSTLLI